MSLAILRHFTPFQSTLLIRGATRRAQQRRASSRISIHAPHTRSDPGKCRVRQATKEISIHAPHTRSDFHPLSFDSGYPSFQSTLLIRGATIMISASHGSQEISIHAPHTRSDKVSSLPLRRYRISIHAPHTRSDQSPLSRYKTAFHFNPRSSYEERHNPIIGLLSQKRYFNPRSSYEERLNILSHCNVVANFNPRSSYEERHRRGLAYTHRGNFNPRSSYEERPGAYSAMYQQITFQSTLLIRGATSASTRTPLPYLFQSTLLIRGATYVLLRQPRHMTISIHAPHTRSDYRCYHVTLFF